MEREKDEEEKGSEDRDEERLRQCMKRMWEDRPPSQLRDNVCSINSLSLLNVLKHILL